MSDKFNEQKETLLSIKHEISLLQQQVDFLLRNEQALGLLDLDVMMNRTHTIYDKMCSVDLGGYYEDEEAIQPEIASSDQGGSLRFARNDEEDPVVNEEEESELEPVEEEPVVEENEDAYFEEEVEEEEPVVEEERHCEEQSDEATPKGSPTEGEVIYFVPNEDNWDGLLRFARNDEEEEPADDVEEEPVVEEEKEPVVEEEEEPVVEEEEEPETLVEKLQQEEDHSLAAKLQHEHLNDLKTAIGINDKFLLVNELFGGSMEKYNKSIDNLNDLKTLNGALVYMNELRIELQWNSSNEAYKKLLELVHRKFE